MHVALSLASLSLAISSVLASPIGRRDATPTALSAAAQSASVPVANFARASYCSAASLINWSCGEACALNPGVKGIASGGNDDLVPGWFVAYDPALDAIIVAHQGTTTTSFLSVLSDIVLTPNVLREDLFPGSLASGAKVHTGFMASQALTASKILAAVQTGVSTYGTTKVITTGHSLGSAIATLDALYLKLELPSLTVSSIQFGLPRVGNDEFAAFYAGVVPNSLHVTYENDPVPRLPGTFLGFSQIEGEVWIHDGVALSCPGLDNSNCAIGASVFDFDTDDHAGPYFGVSLGADYCTA